MSPSPLPCLSQHIHLINVAVTFVVFPKPQGKTKNSEDDGRKELSFTRLTRPDDVEKFTRKYFAKFVKQLGKLVKQEKPDVVLMYNLKAPAEKLKDEKNFGEFFGSKDFSGIGFDLPEKFDFKEAVKKHNENLNISNVLAWQPETEETCPAVYVLPDKWDKPENADVSEAWLKGKKGDETISRLQKLKNGLKEEAKLILNKEPGEVFSEVVDRLNGKHWQVVYGIQTDENGIVKMNNDAYPELLIKKDRSLLLGENSDFALRLCNGFPLSADQREAFKNFAEWAQDLCNDTCYASCNKAEVINAVLRFFLSYPDMEFKSSFCTTEDLDRIKISEDWEKTWNFTFGQLMKKHRALIPWDNSSFNDVKVKGTNEIIGKEAYQEITKKWETKDNTFRNTSDREKLEERFKKFLETLKGFTDWDTAGGDIQTWEEYHLKRWGKYSNLKKEIKDLPESLTKKADADKQKNKKAKKGK